MAFVNTPGFSAEPIRIRDIHTITGWDYAIEFGKDAQATLYLSAKEAHKLADLITQRLIADRRG